MEPDQVLEVSYEEALTQQQVPFIQDVEIQRRIELVSRNLGNRAGVRLLIACALAKIDDPSIDIRKPYTEIGDKDAFSGRKYDEKYVSQFILKYSLPCNLTTAFLTPALRNGNTMLLPGMNLSGRPPELYQAALQLLTDVHAGKTTAQDLLKEVIRQLVLLRDEQINRMESLLAGLRSTRNNTALSAEAILHLIEQHLSCKGSSRLPVIIVAAAYHTVSAYIQETIRPLEAHNAADSQTDSIGDVQVTLIASENIISCYEMKTREVTTGDIDSVIREKLSGSRHRVDHYVFITTHRISIELLSYAHQQYALTGIEFAVLDCLAFLRHFLHFFHRHRMAFLDTYQDLLLQEPDSAISQPLKEVFLALRQAAQSDE